MESSAPDSGRACHVCEQPCPPEEETVCQDCQTMHHQECWNFIGHCSSFACGRQRRRASARSARTEARKPGPATLRGIDGYELPLHTPRTALDLDTPFETLPQVLSPLLACFALVAMFPGHGRHDPETARTLLTSATVIFLPRLVTSFTYVIDNQHRRLLYQRRVLGFVLEYHLASFDEVETVGVIGREQRSQSDPYWVYSVGIRLKTGMTVEVSPAARSLKMATGYATSLADHMGAAASPGFADQPNLGDPSWTVLVGRLPSLKWHGLGGIQGSVSGRWLAWFSLIAGMTLIAWVL